MGIALKTSESRKAYSPASFCGPPLAQRLGKWYRADFEPKSADLVEMTLAICEMEALRCWIAAVLNAVVEFTTQFNTTIFGHGEDLLGV
jgi:hypothetical protein